MFEQMLGSFLGSSQGQAAKDALRQRGVDDSQMQQIFAAALPAAAGSLEQQVSKQAPGQSSALGAFDVLGGHAGQSFLIGAATSMLRGEGMSGALRDGAVGVVGGRIGEALASRLGMDSRLASGLGAAIAPFVLSYAQEQLSGHPDVVAQHGRTPEGQAKFDANLAAKQRMGISPGASGGKGGGFGGGGKSGSMDDGSRAQGMQKPSYGGTSPQQPMQKPGFGGAAEPPMQKPGFGGMPDAQAPMGKPGYGGEGGYGKPTYDGGAPQKGAQKPGYGGAPNKGGYTK
ncbi:MAG: hypothetical protein U0234_28635 [Sandaracinus sp.]